MHTHTHRHMHMLAYQTNAHTYVRVVNLRVCACVCSYIGWAHSQNMSLTLHHMTTLFFMCILFYIYKFQACRKQTELHVNVEFSLRGTNQHTVRSEHFSLLLLLVVHTYTFIPVSEVKLSGVLRYFFSVSLSIHIWSCLRGGKWI